MKHAIRSLHSVAYTASILVMLRLVLLFRTDVLNYTANRKSYMDCWFVQKSITLNDLQRSKRVVTGNQKVICYKRIVRPTLVFTNLYLFIFVTYIFCPYDYTTLFYYGLWLAVLSVCSIPFWLVVSTQANKYITFKLTRRCCESALTVALQSLFVNTDSRQKIKILSRAYTSA